MSLNRKGAICTFGAMSMLFTGTYGVSAYQEIREEVMLEKEKQEKEQAMIAEEKARRAALALKYTGTKTEYIDYAYDSEVISNMLLNRKYSSDEKLVFFTFDNLKSSSVADVISEVFDKYNAKGTFFYSGKQVENIKSTVSPVIKKLYNEGNSIGNRSYSDSYRVLFPGGKINEDNFREEYSKTDTILKDILGNKFKTRAYRCPGGSMSWRGVNAFAEANSANESFGIIDWNISPKGSGTAASIAQSTIKNSANKDVVVILVPNLESEKMKEFLETTMDWYEKNGYQFKSLG